MKPPVRTGDLKFRVRFDRKDSTEDPAGGIVRGWVEHCTRQAAIINQRGGEGVQAQRLQGTQPAIIIVRKDSQTAAIQPSMRAVLLRDGSPMAYYDIKTAADMEGERQFISMQAVIGEPDA